MLSIFTFLTFLTLILAAPPPATEQAQRQAFTEHLRKLSRTPHHVRQMVFIPDITPMPSEYPLETPGYTMEPSLTPEETEEAMWMDVERQALPEDLQLPHTVRQPIDVPPFEETPMPSETPCESPEDHEGFMPMPEGGMLTESPDCSMDPSPTIDYSEEPVAASSLGMTGDPCSTDLDCQPPRMCVSSAGDCPFGAPCLCSPMSVVSCMKSEDCVEGEVCATDGSFDPYCLSKEFVDKDSTYYEVGTEML